MSIGIIIRAGGSTDPDAAAYIAAIRGAGSDIGTTAAQIDATARAINRLVRRAKAEGIWPALGACCLLAGPTTLAGALVPLRGPAPTNFNFVGGDHNRASGLVGNGSDKFLSSNFSSTTPGQNNFHAAAFISQRHSSGASFGTSYNIGAAASGATGYSSRASDNLTIHRNRSSGGSSTTEAASGGLCASSRSNSSSYSAMSFSASPVSVSATSQTPFSGSLLLFAAGTDQSPASFSNERQAAYSFGTNLSLTLWRDILAEYLAAIA